MIYWLQGPSGAGKTTVGRALARLLGIPFVDTDETIEAEHGPIGAIFAERGEGEFRAIERRLVERIVAEDSARAMRVVAVGGGTLLDPVARDAMRASGLRILLDVRPEIALARLGHVSDRPLLTGDTAARWHALVDARARLYADADLRVDAGGEPDHIAEAIFSSTDASGAPLWSLAADLDGERSVIVAYRSVYALAGGLRGIARGRRVCIVADGTVARLYSLTIGALAEDALVHVIEPGEGSKRLEEVELLAGRMAAAGFTRRDLVVGFGGGVATDLAGFAASIYMRGLRAIYVPTTLLAQVDASVGGKTAVNAAGIRNLLGTFRQPSDVLISSAFLHTLPERELRSGFVEALKMGIANSTALDGEVLAAAPGILEGHLPANIEGVIEEGVRAKLDVVAADVQDHGARMSLNFGHTFGHALESAMPGVFAHGEAVAFGMVAAAELSVMLHLLDRERGKRIIDRALPFTHPAVAEVDRAALLGAMRADKKRTARDIRFILPVTAGGVAARDVDEETVLGAVDRALGRIVIHHS